MIYILSQIKVVIDFLVVTWYTINGVAMILTRMIYLEFVTINSDNESEAEL